MLVNFLIIFAVFSTLVSSARILGIVPTPSYSHQIVFKPIWRELSLRGHQVTVLTTDPIRDPTLTNLTEIDASKTYEVIRKWNMNEIRDMSFFEMMDKFLLLMNLILEMDMELPEVQELLNSETERFDLVMMEGVQPVMAAFAEKFNCPLIQMLPLDGLTNNYHYMGNPSHPVLNPDYVLGIPPNGNFLQRLTGTLSLVYGKYFMMKLLDAECYPKYLKKYFGTNTSLEELLEKTSMLFVNADIVFHPLRPTYPNIVQIGGGTHLTPPKPLPKDLSARLDKATNGFIYFSLGSNVRSEKLPIEVRNAFLETFADLPYTVLWKFETDDLPGKSDNVIISKWFPQQDVFKHPNIKLFISQGGLQSTEEAIYHHIPIIGIPFLGDQHANVEKLVRKGMGLELDIKTMTKSVLKDAILEVMNNRKYRDTVKRLAELAKDQPMTGLEKAIWWTEYVIRHKGAPHLRSPALDLPLYQYYLLDVIGFCLTVIALTIYLTYKVIKFVLLILKKTVFSSKAKVD